MNSSSPYILSIDLGTSGPKAALVSTLGGIAGHGYSPHPTDILPGGGAEQDPHHWWRAIVSATGLAMKQSGINPLDIIAISCSTQWSGTVCVGKDGAPLGKAIIWLDSRGSRAIGKQVRGRLNIMGYGIAKLLLWLRLTGGAPGLSGKDSVAHILYLKAEEPERYRATYKFLEPKDYINLRLTGRFCATTDSIALHWVTDNRDVDAIHYDDTLIRMSGIDREKLPDLVRPVDIIGKLKEDAAADLGMRPGIPVIGGTPDVQSAAIGSGGVEDFSAHFYLGTSSWLTCHVPFKKTDVLHGIATLPSAIPGRYFVADEQETAGACLNFLKDTLFFADDGLTGDAPEDVYERFSQLAATAPAGSNGVIFTPWLFGERTPVDDHRIRASLYNQSISTTRADLVRAVFEGVALNGKWLLFCVEKFVKRRLDPIRIIGGGALSDTWCRIFADVFNRTIYRVKDPVLANARGAGLLAAAALGRIGFSDISSLVSVDKTYAPNPENRDLYEKRFSIFKEIYKKNRKIFAQLNDDYGKRY